MKVVKPRSLDSILASTKIYLIGLFTLLLISLTLAGGMILFQNHRTICELLESKLESSSSGIARELALKEVSVALALFNKITDSMKRSSADVSLVLSLDTGKKRSTAKGCDPSILSSNVSQELFFSGEKVGVINGNIKAFKTTHTFSFLLMSILFLSLALKGIKNRLISTVRNQIVKPLEALSEQKELLTEDLPIEVMQIAKNLEEFRRSVSLKAEASMELENARKLSGMANQVAHDLRSPLEVLKGLRGEINNVSLEAGQRFNLSILRVEEITSHLLQKHKGQFQDLEESVHLFTLLLNLLTVKQLEYANKAHVEILHDISSTAFGSFSLVRPGILKSILSNLINNGIEAIKDKTSKVTLTLKSTDSSHFIMVKDTGNGISEALQNKVFQEGFTTKKNGHGLGLYHAKEEVSKMGGELSFETSAIGTTFIIQLPKSKADESWVHELDLSTYERVIILDDDLEWHKLWKKKLSSKDLIHVYSVGEMLSRFPVLDEKTLLLSDYELMDNQLDGIDVAVRYNHIKNSVLITARDGDPIVTEKCQQYGMKILPKSMIKYVPIRELANEAAKPMIVLIDDDRLIRLDWASRCRKDLLKFLSYESIEDFLCESSRIPLNSHIFIDSNLKAGKKGELESEVLLNLGYTKLFLSTGYNKESIVKPNWILEVYSKNPDCISLSLI